LQNRFYLNPEIFQKCGGIGVLVKPDAITAVFMVVLNAGSSAGTSAFANRMRVIETQQSFAFVSCSVKE
jgi:hypothetical protein